jgi:hypothetical protein
VDISKENVLEVRVPYSQATAWLDNVDSGTELVVAGACPARNASRDNGVITMRVFTKLTSPSATSQVRVIVSVRGADNMEFAAPADGNSFDSYYEPQSQDMYVNDESPTSHMFDAGVKSGADDHTVYMGEVVPSLRKLLRRSTYYGPMIFNASGGASTLQTTYVRMQNARFPSYYGYDNDGYCTAASVTGGAAHTFNSNYETPINTVAACYLSHRGSIIWHYNVDSPAPVKHLSAARSNNSLQLSSYGALNSVLGAASTFSMTNSRIAYLGDGHQGLSVLNQLTQTGLSVLVPMYNKFRMQSTSPNLRNLGDALDGSDSDALIFETSLTYDGGGGTALSEHLVQVDRYVGIGTDYSCQMFLNVPTTYQFLRPSLTIVPT